ncbi:hypothetical protein AAHB63_13440 [Bacillus thuringiensis]
MTIKNLDRSVLKNKESQITNVKEALETGDAQAVAARIVANMEGNMQHMQDMMNGIIAEAQQAKTKIGMRRY